MDPNIFSITRKNNRKNRRNNKFLRLKTELKDNRQKTLYIKSNKKNL